jgi:hypothetical protein
MERAEEGASWLGIKPATLARMWIIERLREREDGHRKNEIY